MSTKVFVLGRPGSGKSTAARHIMELARRRFYANLFVQDYDILHKMFIDDRTQEKFHATECGGFDVMDYSILDTALKQLESNVQVTLAYRQTDIVVIEFARDDYRAALRMFSPDFLCDAYFLFLDADIESCIKRVRERVSYPPQPDRHFVSEHIMRTYYSNDNWEYVARQFKQEYALCKEVVAVHNIGSLATLLDEVSDFAEMIFMREFATSPSFGRSTGSTGRSTAHRLSLYEVDHM